MAGISDQAPLKLENRFKFTGQELNYKEFSDGSGLDWYDFRYRRMDPQIGRFLQVDPLGSKFPYNSPYAYAEDKVTVGIDLEGLELLPVFGLDPPVSEMPLEGMTETAADVSEGGTEGIELPRTSGTEDHHIVPKQLKADPLTESARQGGFKFEGKENKIGLQKYSKETGEGQHGNHPNYTTEVSKRFAEFKKDNPNATAEQAAKFLRGVVKEMKETIQNNPNTKVNDLFKSVTPPAPKDNTGIKPPVNTLDVKPPKRHYILM